MAIGLSHVSIRTADLDACRRFYVEVIGLVEGPRPPFPFPGAWLYAGSTADWSGAVIHVIGTDRSDPKGLNDYLGSREGALPQGGGAVDHVAFAIQGLVALRERVKAHGLAARERTVPGLGLHQLFLEDPDGIVVELNFPAEEAVAAG